MRTNSDLAAVHAYLCADGYVIKNPQTQRIKYYKIGLRNTNKTLLIDFQTKFEKVFGVKPRLVKGERCEIGSKRIYYYLVERFGSFYSWEWKMPLLNQQLLSSWLRAYFDCEGYVICKSHQNREIGAECVNELGIIQIKDALNELGIKSRITKRKTRDIFVLNIYGKENITRFKETIGFLHPEKKEKLQQVISDFINYNWILPKCESEQVSFISNIIKTKGKIKKDNGILRIISNRENNLLLLKDKMNTLFNLNSIVKKQKNGIGTIYFELDINKQDHIKKLIDLNLLNEKERDKWITWKLKKTPKVY